MVHVLIHDSIPCSAGPAWIREKRSILDAKFWNVQSSDEAEGDRPPAAESPERQFAPTALTPLQLQYPPPGESDRSRKPQIIAALEEFGCDQRVAELLTRVAVDEGEYDLARVEALKVFHVLECTDAHVRQLIANAIRAVLESSKENDVRNYAAMAAIEYFDFSEVRDALFRILTNVHEDVDLRWNAFPVLERIGSSPETIEIARSLLNEDEFRQSATRVLTEWKVK